MLYMLYPYTNITIGNHHVQWENPLFLWPCSIAMLNYQMVSHLATAPWVGSIPFQLLKVGPPKSRQDESDNLGL